MRVVKRSIVLACVLYTCCGLGVVIVPSLAASQPDYAKWGRIAMQQTSARYQASIVDYEHMGRTQVRAGIAEEKFKLWLRDQNREFGVIITLQFYTANDQLISINYQETT